MKAFIVVLLLIGLPICAMEQEQRLQPGQEIVQGMVLLSKNNTEFLVNEEAIGNSVFLQRHKGANRNKLPLLHSDEVVSFLACVLNDPLHQDDLIRNKIKELQEVKENSVELIEYTAALKEFGLSVLVAVKEMPTEQKPKQFIMSRNANHSRAIYEDPRRAITRICYSKTCCNENNSIQNPDQQQNECCTNCEFRLCASDSIESICWSWRFTAFRWLRESCLTNCGPDGSCYGCFSCRNHNQKCVVQCCCTFNPNL